MIRRTHKLGGIEALKPSINVTPLVDVVLVLLIIFMVIAPKLDQDISVTLPGVFNADPDAGAAAPLKVSMPAPDAFRYDGRTYDLNGMIAILEVAHAAEPSRRLVLRADAGLPYGKVRELQRRVQEIGFPGLSFLVNERHRWEEADPIAEQQAADPT